MADEPRYVTLDADSVDDHHLCCALGDPKHAAGVERKREWLRQRFAEGLVFRKLDVRGKVFIEYAPAEFAWRPVDAPGWLVIHCLWVSGRFAGHGHGSRLVADALADAARRDRLGLVVASGATKRPFLSDPRWLARRGFVETDRVGTWRLWALPVGEIPSDATPRFRESLHGQASADGDDDEFVARYDDQCPFNPHWSGEVVDALRRRGRRARAEHVASCADAQNSRSPLGTYGLERGGELVCHHLTTDAATGRLLDKLGPDPPARPDSASPVAE